MKYIFVYIIRVNTICVANVIFVCTGKNNFIAMLNAVCEYNIFVYYNFIRQ